MGSKVGGIPVSLIALAGVGIVAYIKRDWIKGQIDNITNKVGGATDTADVSGAAVVSGAAQPTPVQNYPFGVPAAGSQQPEVYPLPGGGGVYTGGSPIMTGNPSVDAQLQGLQNVVPSAHTQIGQTPGGQTYPIIPGSPTIVPADQIPGPQFDYYGQPIGPYGGGPFDPYGQIVNPYYPDVYGQPGYDTFLDQYSNISGKVTTTISDYPMDDYGEDGYAPFPGSPVVQVPGDFDPDIGVIIRPDSGRCKRDFGGKCDSECKNGPSPKCLACTAACGGTFGHDQGLHLGQFDNIHDWAKDHRNKKTKKKKNKHKKKKHSHFATLSGIV
jgi:hypothetical protein